MITVNLKNSFYLIKYKVLTTVNICPPQEHTTNVQYTHHFYLKKTGHKQSSRSVYTGYR